MRLKRLKPGFEAQTCIVTSIGRSIEIPSRNRTILVGVIRDIQNRQLLDLSFVLLILTLILT